MELLFTLILSIILWTGVKSACPRGYTSVPISGGERCFIVPREYKYWLDARETCINVHQGHLVEILSTLDLAHLAHLFSGLAEEEKKDFYDYDLWTGGVTQDDGSWIWNFTGAAVNRAFTEHLPKLEKQALTIDVNSVQLKALTIHMNCENPIREPRIRNFVCETKERREKEEKEEKKTEDLDREKERLRLLSTLSIRKLREVEKALREKEREQDVLKRQLEELRRKCPGSDQCEFKSQGNFLSYDVRIVGGRPAEKPWPWAALLIFDENLDVRCGGTLIADGWILTAGHCVAGPGGPTLLRIRLGDRVLKNDTEIEHRDYPIIKAIKHENYTKPLPNDNDIALIKFNNSECYPDHVYPVFLPISFVGVNLVGKTPYAVGWGSTEFQGPQSDILLQTQLTVEDTQDCIDSFGAFRGVNISSSKLCAYEDGRDTCQGDSGGGLFLPNPNTSAKEGVNYEIIGVVSFGYKCAEKDKPGIYTRVTEYLNWIEETIKNN